MFIFFTASVGGKSKSTTTACTVKPSVTSKNGNSKPVSSAQLTSPCRSVGLAARKPSWTPPGIKMHWPGIVSDNAHVILYIDRILIPNDHLRGLVVECSLRMCGQVIFKPKTIKIVLAALR